MRPRPTCKLARKMCAQCSVRDGLTFLRVQTNSYPSHCYQSKVAPSTSNIDFEVLFNPQWKDSRGSGPLPSQFRSYGDPTPGVVGVAFTGVAIASGSQQLEACSMDQCLGSVTASLPFYHYSSFSPCLQSCLQPGLSAQPCQGYQGCSTNTQSYMLSGVTPHVTPVGIALDGRIIYGPFKSPTSLWKPQDLDTCNGATINGGYGYALTSTAPFSPRCFGPQQQPQCHTCSSCQQGGCHP